MREKKEHNNREEQSETKEFCYCCTMKIRDLQIAQLKEVLTKKQIEYERINISMSNRYLFL